MANYSIFPGLEALVFRVFEKVEFETLAVVWYTCDGHILSTVSTKSAPPSASVLRGKHS
jgi:hypothetical protein